MNNYVYQIKGVLESPAGKLKGLRILVCDLYNFDQADVPIEVLDNEIIKYLEFRLKITAGAIKIQNLPDKVQNNIRAHLGDWLDRWVLDNFYGETTGRKT